MISVDTNVLVRLLANDDRIQSARAAELVASEDVYITKTVLLETEWVLRFSYRLSLAAISAAFEGLLSVASIALEDDAAVRMAVAAHRAGMDFADALHVASSGPATSFSTFDKKLARHAGRGKIPVSVNVL